MRVVLITGGSRGIGNAIARSALDAGYAVHLLARDADVLRSSAAKLQSHGDVNYSVVDLAESAAVVQFCRQWQGEIHGLVNNAGYWLEDPVGTLDPQLFQAMLSVNLLAPYILTKGMLGKIRRGGRVVNIASQLGTQGRERMGAYSATKHGLVGLTKCWAPEVWEQGITVNVVCPGWVNTESNRSDLSLLAAERGTTLEQELGRIANTLALRRFIEPEEVANVVTFLLSGQASGITGQVYEIK